jgi:hypothetical protein
VENPRTPWGSARQTPNTTVEMTKGNLCATPFEHKVHEPGYTEAWVEGMVVLHNPHARIELPPEMIPGASHEFLQPDGRIMSLVPEFHPLFSQTEIKIADEKGT